MSCCSPACSARTAGVQRGASKFGARTYSCMGSVCGGFRDFILRGNVVDLAVAIVIGSSFTALVNALVADWLTPFIAIIFKPEEVFGDLTFTINGSVFRYGHFLNVLFTFVLICTILYFFVVLPINSLLKYVTAQKTRECPECCSDISIKARRCKFCCAAVEPTWVPKKGSSRKVTEDGDELIVRTTSSPARAQQQQHSPAPTQVQVVAHAKGTPVPADCDAV